MPDEVRLRGEDFATRQQVGNRIGGLASARQTHVVYVDRLKLLDALSADRRERGVTARRGRARSELDDDLAIDRARRRHRLLPRRRGDPAGKAHDRCEENSSAQGEARVYR